MQSPRPLRTNRDYYDRFSERYEDGRDRGYHALLDRLEVGVIEELGQGRRVLEAGCGTGLLLRRVRDFARQAVGVDLSAGMLARARARGLDVHQASVTHLPFADASFDVVYSFKVLAHVEPIRDALAELARVLRPGGHLVAEFYNSRSLRYLVKRLKPAQAVAHDATDHEVFTRYDDLAAIRGYLPAGCELVRVRGVRVVTPVAQVFAVPGLAAIFQRLEELACDAPLLRHLGGFLIVVARKRGGSAV